ncbi:hypothetical protein ACNKHT_03165 [Shigella flexneri]
MVSKPFQRPFSLATRLTFFIAWPPSQRFSPLHDHDPLSKSAFCQQDINDLKEISATLERVLNHLTKRKPDA